MTRRPREDEPGAILHIRNRGIAKRPVFENAEDARYFKSRLAREHRRGRLKIHAYVILANHYHLVVESLTGEASDALRVIQNQYVRRFNRQRKRDGPLFRGRFKSTRVRSHAYWYTLLRYIDLHSIKARITTNPGLYPFGSALNYLTGEGPRWLTMERVHELLVTGPEAFEPAIYESFLGTPLSPAERELVELRMRGERDGADPLDDLLLGGPPGIRHWMARKASCADGTRPGISLASPTRVAEVIARHRALLPTWSARPSGRSRNAWVILLAGLMRDACALSHREIANRTRTTISTVQRRVATHRKLGREDEEYAHRSAVVLAEVLDGYAAWSGIAGAGLGG